ncbi:MAG TPA: DNA translocase FtsK 4TM domain-containing protein [Bacteroidales bacterium]|nr:DNA translocase FtsK 4TM domain-containing protein [Bacteroidales bacterium]
MGKQKKTGSSHPKKDDPTGTSFNEKIRFITGVILLVFAIYMLVVFISYLSSGKADQDSVNRPDNESDYVYQNWGGKFGFNVGYYFIFKGFGLGAFFIPFIIGAFSLALIRVKYFRLWKNVMRFLLAGILLSVILGFAAHHSSFLGAGPGGEHGYLIAEWMNKLMGKIGTGASLLVFTVAYLIFAVNVSTHAIRRPIAAVARAGADVLSGEGKKTDVINDDVVIAPEDIFPSPEDEPLRADEEETEPVDDFYAPPAHIIEDSPLIKVISKEPRHFSTDDFMDESIPKLPPFDPRLTLPHYRFPTVSLLKDYRSATPTGSEEVNANKDNIIKTLADHKIIIKQISATVGPTVTLYEVVPDRGVKIHRIKSLENDIALSLSALGIRIIAPIPGRGTVGIEVPNKKAEIVSMRGLLSSQAFLDSKFELPLALGRTITNDPYIIDLTRMPHLLVAGATGQGKSVGLNAIITSLLYKKHPAEIKLVLIDPKRVELPLYAKIERHFLAKLPGDEDAIITDTKKVINTLNSLCILMDHRLELLKMSQTRNIKEYNDKFIARRLNPEKGHEYMPYIVLIIDEFADLIMTAGREIESPIGRLAQLSRAIGIHLIISTQRPSANIITGFIKANFPSRIAFRVFSGVDSRTILDSSGADRLVGRGDMLISQGGEPVRVQCAFIDTPEIEVLTDYIGSQHGYPNAMHLPEYVGDDESDNGSREVDLKKRDPLFDEAARLVVTHQQGSTSLIQRRMQLGYNRAGRIIDQLEAAGIVGQFEGSKARNVVVQDMNTLEQILKRLNEDAI